MKVSFSKHALEQMALRGISKENVIRVLDSPDSIVHKEDYIIYQKIVKFIDGTFLIRVFLNNKKVPPLVITTYRTTKISTYHED